MAHLETTLCKAPAASPLPSAGGLFGGQNHNGKFIQELNGKAIVCPDLSEDSDASAKQNWWRQAENAKDSAGGDLANLCPKRQCTREHGSRGLVEGSMAVSFPNTALLSGLRVSASLLKPVLARHDTMITKVRLQVLQPVSKGYNTHSHPHLVLIEYRDWRSCARE